MKKIIIASFTIVALFLSLARVGAIWAEDELPDELQILGRIDCSFEI